jgi:DNA invertase Pin-like site-specific DNA recombinase
MSSQRIGYIRVSTLDQSTGRQLDGIAVDKIFTDKASGKDINRPQLQAALHHIRTGDTLVVHSMDRLARNVEDMLRLVREMNDRGVSVNFIKENMSFTAGSQDPRSTLMFTMLSAFAQFERSLIKESSVKVSPWQRLREQSTRGGSQRSTQRGLLICVSRLQPEPTGQSWRKSLV